MPPYLRAHPHQTRLDSDLASATTTKTHVPNSKTGRRLPEQEYNSHPLWLDGAELVFDARMKAASSSAEYTKRVSERKYTVTKAHDQVRC